MRCGKAKLEFLELREMLFRNPASYREALPGLGIVTVPTEPALKANSFVSSIGVE
jgi:hypothetical protein